MAVMYRSKIYIGLMVLRVKLGVTIPFMFTQSKEFRVRQTVMPPPVS